MIQIITTKHAPSAIGPYSQAKAAGGFVFVSGQLPIDPKTNEFAGSDIKSQTHQSIKNIEAILKEADCTLEQVCKTTVFLDDIQDFAPMNEIYAEFFKTDCPARAAFAVKDLPKGAKVEVEVVAYKGE
jgi:2-iminobutanoate/2-iminopropanoate deaminase